jgi:hypothetical protein
MLHIYIYIYMLLMEPLHVYNWIKPRGTNLNLTADKMRPQQYSEIHLHSIMVYKLNGMKMLGNCKYDC